MERNLGHFIPLAVHNCAISSIKVKGCENERKILPLVCESTLLSLLPCLLDGKQNGKARKISGSTKFIALLYTVLLVDHFTDADVFPLLMLKL